VFCYFPLMISLKCFLTEDLIEWYSVFLVLSFKTKLAFLLKPHLLRTA